MECGGCIAAAVSRLALSRSVGVAQNEPSRRRIRAITKKRQLLAGALQTLRDEVGAGLKKFAPAYGVRRLYCRRCFPTCPIQICRSRPERTKPKKNPGDHGKAPATRWRTPNASRPGRRGAKEVRASVWSAAAVLPPLFPDLPYPDLSESPRTNQAEEESGRSRKSASYSLAHSKRFATR